MVPGSIPGRSVIFLLAVNKQMLQNIYDVCVFPNRITWLNVTIIQPIQSDRLASVFSSEKEALTNTDEQSKCHKCWLHKKL